MKLISYNVNGLRAALKKDLLEWVKKEDPDLFCIQESKSQAGQVPAELFENLGYHAYWHSAQKKGYSGVVTYSKQKASKVVEGMGMEKYDIEGRVLRTDYKDLTIVCLLYTSPSPRDRTRSRMPSSA